MAFCNQCGSEVPADARFCQNCGAALAAPAGVTNELPTITPAPGSPSAMPVPPYAPVPTYQPAPYGPAPYTYAPEQAHAPRRSGKATAGMWLGIASIFPGAVMNWVGILLGILGIVFSAIALSDIRAFARRTNGTDAPDRGKAITGIICSIVGIVLSTLFLVYILQNYDIHSFTPTRK